MKRWVVLLCLMVFLVGCQKVQETKPASGNAQLEIANPASVYCEQNNGTLEIVTAAGGSQAGICTLKDGTRCDEWAYYRGECPENLTRNITVQQNITEPYCGDGICQADEPGNCPQDCCGDDICATGENFSNCKIDCCGPCGDGRCMKGDCHEDDYTSSYYCVEDCGPTCGNSICEGGETPETCGLDCRVY